MLDFEHIFLTSHLIIATELHQKMETEYKDMMKSYEKQYDEYNKSIQDRDGKLIFLENQIKTQINNIEGKLKDVQNQENNTTTTNSRMKRINELAQPKIITPKKI